jgi:hypothetical protein
MASRKPLYRVRVSSSGLIYAVIVGAWAAYLVPMWLRRQDELNEARPTERFSTAIRLLSGRGAMERRYARELQARSTGDDEPYGDPDEFTGSVDLRSLAVPTVSKPRRARAARPAQDAQAGPGVEGSTGRKPGARSGDLAARQAPAPRVSARYGPEQPSRHPADGATAAEGARAGAARPSPERLSPGAAEAAARAQRSKVLARRRRTTVTLFVTFTLGSVVAGIGGIAFLWAPGVPAVLLSGYIAYLRRQERRRFAYTMDRRRAEAAAQRLRTRRPHARPGTPASGDASAYDPTDPSAPDDPDAPDDGPAAAGTAELSALAAGRRALVEQTDHAEWVDDQQRERRRGLAQGDSWDPVPVPLPTYVTAPVAPRAGGDIDLGAPDTWSSARSSSAEPPARDAGAGGRAGSSGAAGTAPTQPGNGREGDGRRDGTASPAGSPDDDQDDRPRNQHGTGARRAASVPPRRTPPGSTAHPHKVLEESSGPWSLKGRGGAPGARERGRTPLFDQYADDDHPRAAGQ